MSAGGGGLERGKANSLSGGPFPSLGTPINQHDGGAILASLGGQPNTGWASANNAEIGLEDFCHVRQWNEEDLQWFLWSQSRAMTTGCETAIQTSLLR
jgi:hypothetical protein